VTTTEAQRLEYILGYKLSLCSSVTLCGLLSDSDFHYADVLSKEFSFIVAHPPC
jgi:hypothetical protein